MHEDKSRAEPEGYIMPEAQTRAHLGPAAGRPALPLPSTSTEETTDVENAGDGLVKNLKQVIEASSVLWSDENLKEAGA